MEFNAGDEVKKKMFSSFFKTNKLEFNRCLESSMRCKKKAIRAHSVQNACILERLCQNGHISAFRLRVDRNKLPQLSLGLVSRNKATTFTGLCSKHDQEMFSAIDNKRIDLENKEHLFLTAYRSVYRGLHATMEAALKIQSSFQQRVDLRIDPENIPSVAGEIALEKMIVSFETWQYKTGFDKIYIDQNYDLLMHDTIIVNHDQPTIAVSALFSMDEYKIKGDVLRIILNVIPVSDDQTFVIFSYRKQETDVAHVALDRILMATGKHQLYEVSRIILNSCENFVLSPSYVQSWEDSKRETITNYFIRTMFNNDLEYQSPDLYLF